MVPNSSWVAGKAPLPHFLSFGLLELGVLQAIQPCCMDWAVAWLDQRGLQLALSRPNIPTPTETMGRSQICLKRDPAYIIL